MLQNILDLQIFKCSSYPIPVLKLLKPDSLKWEIRWSNFSRHAKFGHQQQPRGYTVGTTVGFPVEIMEALAPPSHRRKPWKCPQ
jgi:hypothetical protein